MLTIRMSEADYERLKKMAWERRLPTETYCRQVLLGPVMLKPFGVEVGGARKPTKRPTLVENVEAGTKVIQSYADQLKAARGEKLKP